jgi:hypothetical protein
MTKAYAEADMEGDAIAALYQDLSDYTNNDMTVSGLNTTITDAAVNIDGLFFPPSEFQRDTDGFHVLANIAWIYATFTP